MEETNMTTPAHAAAEAEIRELMKARIEAVKSKNVEALVAHHAPSVLAYDLVEPLQYTGLEALRGRVRQWFDGFESAMSYEIRDLKVTADDEVAFCHGLHHVSGIAKGGPAESGKKIDMYWRATQCLRCIGGKWMIVHEHSSVPFDMATGKASFDLKPETQARAA
jgi:ketosteroid isomerase-like protein